MNDSRFLGQRVLGGLQYRLKLERGKGICGRSDVREPSVEEKEIEIEKEREKMQEGEDAGEGGCGRGRGSERDSVTNAQLLRTMTLLAETQGQILTCIQTQTDELKEIRRTLLKFAHIVKDMHTP
jgi:hypothetical protein